MSTRGFVGVQLKDTIKGLYNGSDSYPSYLGRAVVDSLKALDPIKSKFKTVLIENYKSIVWTSYEKDESKLSNLQAHLLPHLFLTRALGLTSDLQEVRDYFNNPKLLFDSSNFLSDELFCEWAYVINLDSKTLDVRGREGWASWPLFKLPTDIIKQMEKLK